MNEITLTCDTIVHTAGCRLYVPDSTVTLIDTKACAELIEKLTESEAIAMQKTYINKLEAAIDALDVQCKFWRQAAEHAVTGWNALEDRVEAAKEALGALEGNIDAVHELLGSSDEWAPPVPVPPMQCAKEPEVNGWPLRIVEDETPLECNRCTCGVMFRTDEDYNAHLPCRVQG